MLISKIRKTGWVFLILLPTFALAPAISAESKSIPINKDDLGIAIKGYDTVAYFTDGRAVKGNPEFEAVWQDARWHFVSAAHRDMFKAEPERYAPQYGGY